MKSTKYLNMTILQLPPKHNILLFFILSIYYIFLPNLQLRIKMLLQHHHHLSVVNFLPLGDHRCPSSTGKRPIFFPISSFSSSHHHQDPQNPEATTSRSEGNFLRTHNAKSAALLLRHLPSHQEPSSSPPPPAAFLPGEEEEDPNPIPQEDKVKILEMSLVTKRTPQFPGSIYVQSSCDPDVSSSLPPINTLVEPYKGPTGVLETYTADDDEMLLKALKIRRKVTVEILKQAMRKGKFGITYSTNLIDRLPDYIDYVMIQAASMKQLPEFSSSSYNVRARTFIDRSGVVPLIRCKNFFILGFFFFM